jgi:hypothetical protein
MHGATPMVATDHSDSNGGIAPCQLLDGGNHFDDMDSVVAMINNDDAITKARMKTHRCREIDYMIWLLRQVSRDRHC